MDLIKQAEKFAREKHEGQFRKDGVTPYIEHPKEVVGIVRELGISAENLICSAWLHDTIEDCNVSERELSRKFNREIAMTVQRLTRDVNRKKYLERISNSGYEVQIIKLADVTHNSFTMNNIGVSSRCRKKLTDDCVKFYIPLAERIAPVLAIRIKGNLGLLESPPIFEKWYSPMHMVDGRYWMEDGFD